MSCFYRRALVTHSFSPSLFGVLSVEQLPFVQRKISCKEAPMFGAIRLHTDAEQAGLTKKEAVMVANAAELYNAACGMWPTLTFRSVSAHTFSAHFRASHRGTTGYLTLAPPRWKSGFVGSPGPGRSKRAQPTATRRPSQGMHCTPLLSHTDIG